MHIGAFPITLFFGMIVCLKLKTFYRTCVLPELIGKWYTRPITPNVENQHDEEVKNTSNS